MFSEAVKRTRTETSPPPLTRAGAAGAAGLPRAHQAVRGGVRDHHRPQPALHQADRHVRGPASPVMTPACATHWYDHAPTLNVGRAHTEVCSTSPSFQSLTFAFAMKLGAPECVLCAHEGCRSGDRMDPMRGAVQRSAGGQGGRVTGRGYMDVNRISGYIPGKMVFFLMQARQPGLATRIHDARASLRAGARTAVPRRSAWRWRRAAWQCRAARCTQRDCLSVTRSPGDAAAA
jgi:hypothetical protein